MKAKNHTLTVALCVSLIAHGLGLSGMAWWYIQHNLFTKTPPIDRYQVMAGPGGNKTAPTTAGEREVREAQRQAERRQR
jgi:hypothetical protein